MMQEANNAINRRDGGPNFDWIFELLQSSIVKMLFPAPTAETQMMLTLSAVSGCGGVHREAFLEAQG
jgi:hypothetical protein